MCNQLHLLIPLSHGLHLGRNPLNGMVKDICSKGKITEIKTNHSLRATSISEPFRAGVPEKLIQEWSGHLSLDGLRQYQRTTFSQHKAVLKVLASGSSYESQVATVGQQKTQSVVVSHFTPTPQMNFSACNITIYSGPPATPLLDVTNSDRND